MVLFSSNRQMPPVPVDLGHQIAKPMWFNMRDLYPLPDRLIGECGVKETCGPSPLACHSS
jgi:hypothetical protein